MSTKNTPLPADGGSYTLVDGKLTRTQAPTAPAPGKTAERIARESKVRSIDGAKRATNKEQ